MNSQLLIRIDNEIKERFSRLAKREGKNLNQKVRELIEDYIAERDIGPYIDQTWKKITKNFKKNKINEKDIYNAIMESRKNSRK